MEKYGCSSTSTRSIWSERHLLQDATLININVLEKASEFYVLVVMGDAG
jgi:hypothetical protein